MGKYTRYFSRGKKVTNLTETQENIFKEITENEGSSQSDIGLILGVSRQVVNYNIRYLLEKDLIEEVRVGNRCQYYLK